MVDEAERLLNEVRQIKAQYVAEVGRGRRVWPRSIKERIAKLDELGLPPKAIAEKTQVPYETIILWRYKRRTANDDGAFHELSVAREKLPAISKSVSVTVPTDEMSGAAVVGKKCPKTKRRSSSLFQEKNVLLRSHEKERLSSAKGRSAR